MAKDHFQFKQFSIFHDKCAMKVGTDGVLLGAWCNVESKKKVLDIGTGSGLIAIMIAQRNAGCVIDAVEVDRASCRQAAENVARCPWKTRINVHHSSFQEFAANSENAYDLIVSNPPYFQNSLPNPVRERSVARHAHSLSMKDLIGGVKKLLHTEGRYCMIMPVPEAEIFKEKAFESELYCRMITSAHPNPGKPAKRLLLEFSKTQGETKKTGLAIELNRRHEYSDEFKRLTENFYLHFQY